MKLQAGSLLYAIFIAFLVFSASSSFIIFSYYGNQFYMLNERQVIDQVNLNSAIELGISDSYDLLYDQPTTVQLFEGDERSVISLNKTVWGVYDILTCTTKDSKRKQSKSVLLGSSSIQSNPLAIYLADNNEPLSLAGKTIINGNGKIPKSGIRRAYIESQTFTGTLPTSKKNDFSEANLPELNQNRVNMLAELVQGKLKNDSVVSIDNLFPNVSIENSWLESTGYFKSENKIALNNSNLRGNIIVQSKVEIEITDCHLRDVIFIAPIIKIKDQNDGSFQAFASDSIIVKGFSELAYPSAIGIVDLDKKRTNKPAIVLNKNTTISGDVILYSETNRYKNHLNLICEKGSKITGYTYVNGKIELKGTIYGQLYCEGFTLKTPSSIYSNHILNAEINRSKLPSNFQSSLASVHTNKSIIKCLN